MGHYIRWSGLAIFAVLCAIIFSIVCFFAEPIAKSAIEQQTSKYTGAEVNVGEVDIVMSPFAITVFNMELTDPKKPSQNMVSFEKAHASVSLWPYLFGKTIIDSLDVSELAFNTIRTNEGAVYVVPEEKTQASDALDDNWLSSMQDNLPDPKAVLADANLKTVKRAQAFEASYQQEQEKIKAIKANLPSTKKLKEFQDKVKALSKTKINDLSDIERVKKEFDLLKKEFKAEQAKVREAKDTLIASKNTLSERLTDLKNAPAEDWQDIEQKYQLDNIEGEDFAHIVFGDKAREYYQFADMAFKYIKPLLDKESAQSSELLVDSKGGRFVHFEEDEPTPNFWLKKANISIVLPQGRYQLVLDDVTHQHWLIHKKSRLTLAADSANQTGDIKLDAGFALSQAQDINADGLWTLKDLPLDNIDIQNSDSLTLALTQGLLAGQGNFTVENGKLILDSLFSLADNEFTGQASSKLGHVVLDTLKGMKEMSMDIDATGNMLSPDWSVSSPLNNIFSQALTQQVSGKLNEYKAQLQSGLTGKMQGALDLGQGQESELLDIEALLTDSDNALESLKNNDIVKQKQKELENKAKDKLKEKLGKLFG